MKRLINRQLPVFLTYEVIWASLSQPHTTVNALQDACVCMYRYVCLRVAIYRKFKLNGYTCIRKFQICTRAKALSCDLSLHAVTPCR